MMTDHDRNVNNDDETYNINWERAEVILSSGFHLIFFNTM